MGAAPVNELTARTVFFEAIAEHKLISLDLADAVREPFVALVAAAEQCINEGGKIIVFGNGGSAAQAQHLAAELIGRFHKDRVPYAAIALNADTAVLTAIGNDLGYKNVFSRQMRGLVAQEDLAIGLTTSGQSKNVILALDLAKHTGAATAVLTGAEGYPANRSAEITLAVPSQSIARIQEMHLLILHAFVAALEGIFCGTETNGE